MVISISPICTHFIFAVRTEEAPLVTADPDVDDKPGMRGGVGTLLLDFSNVFKAFIGTNFLGLPYAYGQAGLIVRSLIR